MDISWVYPYLKTSGDKKQTNKQQTKAKSKNKTEKGLYFFYKPYGNLQL